ncbi:cation:dicarboxylase symporter family transporter [Gluconacetobacter diazotrophicus]|uniref:Cation:dicarboxylase symporter family transporter n=1 Tax=Gluconacetobacter diazotrophicus TaxID=33996 RepID=A0A7W4I5U0_GLUDI|nr:cation:dicarboxylase symporter family transporter [Gluconacetobacter diazotrophicus]MBB2156803.1 cation:dicarboxylase symporter family transporter [Gluconacetobacter diazotrophicus]
MIAGSPLGRGGYVSYAVGMTKAPLYQSLFLQIVVATAGGVAIGLLDPALGMALRPLSDLFLRLIAMIVSPLVFCVVVQGIAGAGSLRTVGRVGIKALVYFEAMTTLALGFGLLAAGLAGPGRGMHVPLAGRAVTDGAVALGSVGGSAAALRQGGIGAFLLNIVPTSPVRAFAGNDVLQILFFAILFGCALTQVGPAGQPVARVIDGLTAVMFRIMGIVTRVAPVGVLGAVAWTVGHYGAAALGQLGLLVVLYVGTVAAFVALALGLVMRRCGVGLWRLLVYLRAELLIVAATTASDAVLPQTMDKLERLGIRREVVGLVIPAGYSFNLDALSIYLGMAVLFLAQATGTVLGWGQMALVLGTALVTSKGAHGVPGVAIVILAATLAVVPQVPPIGLVLVVSVDWFIGIARALGNFVGNCVATIAVAAWEGEIDLAQARRVLAAGDDAAAEAPLTAS